MIISHVENYGREDTNRYKNREMIISYVEDYSREDTDI